MANFIFCAVEVNGYKNSISKFDKKNKAEPFQNIKTMHGKIITTMRLYITFIDLLANLR